MEPITAKLHASIGSLPSSCSLTGFLSSDEETSPIKTYPVYVTNNGFIILNEEYKMQHCVQIETEITHISCCGTKIAICTKSDVRIMQQFGVELRTLCIVDEQRIDNACFFLNGNGLCITKANKITLYAVEDLIHRYDAQLDAIEKAKEKLKKRKKMGKGLESGATTPKSLIQN
eukprot:511664_1